ncbi:MAG: ATP-binding domain-containing protein, partial [Clostridia bacterium]|nr:ATP-binding domain-containing protein [Clostridia bacterium]
PDAYGFKGIEDIQILCPSRKSDTGSVNLNNLLQEKFNPLQNKMPQLFYKGFYIRPGDKVMQIKNNYDIEFVKDSGETGFGVFNGDIGYVENIDLRGGIVKVRFDDRVVTYYSENIGELELAYAMTVHKSQGSEFECVIIPLLDIPAKLCYRNLLYTAVTRAKKLLILVGSEKVWNNMAANNKKNLRYTLLKEFIKENEIL